jgi:protein SCO1/2
MITRRALFTPLATVPFAALAAAVPARASTSDPAGGRRHFPNVTLRTQDDEPVRFYDDLVKDKIVMLNFFYVSCTGICPASTANLVKVQQLLGDRVGRDIFMYSISLKPREDRPAQLKEYVEMHGIKAGWTLLTGKPDDCELLRRRLGFADPDPVRDRDVTNHIGLVVYGNERLDSWAACPARTEPTELVKYLSWMDRA